MKYYLLAVLVIAILAYLRNKKKKDRFKPPTYHAGFDDPYYDGKIGQILIFRPDLEAEDRLISHVEDFNEKYKKEKIAALVEGLRRHAYRKPIKDIIHHYPLTPEECHKKPDVDKREDDIDWELIKRPLAEYPKNDSEEIVYPENHINDAIDEHIEEQQTLNDNNEEVKDLNIKSTDEIDPNLLSTLIEFLKKKED